MKAIGRTEFGGSEVLKIVDLPEPQPGPGEVRIKVHAAAAKPTGITFRAGEEPPSWLGGPLPTCPA